MASQDMVAVILSDIHIGDDRGIVSREPDDGYVAVNGAFVREELPEKLAAVNQIVQAQGKKIHTLILNGDVWDVAVRSVAVVADVAAAFFEAVRLDHYFDEILFLPGNHDHHLWQLLQTQTCILRPLENRLPPASASGGSIVREFPNAQSGFLDLPSGTLTIPGVQGPYVGDVYLSALTGGTLPVNVVYPNLFIRVHMAAGTEGTVVTHGHFFELAWSLLSDLVAEVLEKREVVLDLATLEMLNAPLTEFINFSLAQQDGRVAEIVSSIYDGARTGTIPELAELRDGLIAILEEVLNTANVGATVHWVREELLKLVAGYLMRRVGGKARGAVQTTSTARPAPSSARFDTSFLDHPEAQRRIGVFLTMSQAQLGVTPIRRLVFGHTHDAFATRTQKIAGTGPIEVWNTGGWVPEQGRPCSILAIGIDSNGVLQGF